VCCLRSACRSGVRSSVFYSCRCNPSALNFQIWFRAMLATCCKPQTELCNGCVLTRSLRGRGHHSQAGTAALPKITLILSRTPFGRKGLPRNEKTRVPRSHPPGALAATRGLLTRLLLTILPLIRLPLTRPLLTRLLLTRLPDEGAGHLPSPEGGLLPHSQSLASENTSSTSGGRRIGVGCASFPSSGGAFSTGVPPGWSRSVQFHRV
jgi:hypothetical protein